MKKIAEVSRLGNLGFGRHLPWLWWLLVFASASGAGAQPGAVGTWTSLKTAHFTFFTNTPENVARSTAYDLEEMRNVLLQLWPKMELDSPIPTLIYVFEDDESFHPYRLLGDPAASNNQPRRVGQGSLTAGYLVPHEHGSYAALAIHSETRPMRFVYKQYIHHFLHQRLPTLPLWLRHGLAEYYSTFEIEGEKALLGKPIKAHRDRLLYWQGTGRLDGVLRRESIPSDADAATGFFAYSWALFHYFQSDVKLGRQLQDFAQQVVAEVPASEAFAQAFDFGVAELEKRVAAYVAQTSFNYLEVPIDRGAHPMRVFPLAEHEVLYHLGDLLAHAHPGRGAEAADHFRRALALEPRAGLSHAGLGFLAEEAGDHEVALVHYEKALESADEDFLVRYLYGRRLARSFGDRRPVDQEQEARLGRAIQALAGALELEPNFAPAWAELGYAQNLESKPGPQAAASLEKALELLPGRLDILFNLLLAYARLGDREATDAVVERMRWLGVDEATLQRAREVQLRMDYQEAARLVRGGQLDDGIALFAQIERESKDSALGQLVAEQLEKFESAASHLRFIELYREVGRLLVAKDLDAAAKALAELDGMAKPGSQREVVDKFFKTLELLKNQELARP